MFKNNGKLFVISGPSASGKGTLVKELVESRNDVYLSVSATSRKPRDSEKESVSYYFLEESDFTSKIEDSYFLEWAKVYGNYYGTPKEKVFERLKNSQHVILEIDIQGAMQIKSKYSEAILVFVLPPSFKELEKRIIKRKSETEESLRERLDSCQKEMEKISLYDYFVVNDDIPKSFLKLNKLIDSSDMIVNKNIIDYIHRTKGEFRF